MVNLRDIHDSILSFSHKFIKNPGQIKVFVPAREEHGDISTNIVMILAKEANLKPTNESLVDHSSENQKKLEGKVTLGVNIPGIKSISPKDFFDNIKEDLEKLPYIEKVNFVSGFCNFFLSEKFLEDGLREILLKKEFFGFKDKNSIRVNLEYISANPTGYVHLGHTRGIYADAIANLLDFCGYEVTRENYINDTGNQIQIFSKSVFYEYAKLAQVDFAEPEESYPGEHIATIAAEIYSENPNLSWDKDHLLFADLVLKKMLGYIREDLNFLSINHDVWASERYIQENGFVDEAIKILEEKGLVFEGTMGEIISGKGKKSEVPIKIFKSPDGEKALTKSDGSFTYFAGDIGYHYYKIKRGFDWIIDFLGADHGGQIPPLRYGVEQLGAKKFTIVLCQSVAYTSDGMRKKFSKRKGNVIRPKDLDIDSPDVLRFLMTSKSIDTHCTINLDDLTEISENSFYYIQYANARCNSILNTARDIWPDFSDDHLIDFVDFDSYDASLKNIISLLLKWPLEAEMCYKSLSVTSIHTYLQKVASKFHNLWTIGKTNPQAKFIIETDKKLSYTRLAVVKAISYILTSGFKVLGITPLKQVERAE